MDLKEFGLFIAQKREDSGFESQRQFALATGVSNGTIARIEAGTQKASPSTLKKLAPFLKEVEYEDLLEKLGYLEIEMVQDKPKKENSAKLIQHKLTVVRPRKRNINKHVQSKESNPFVEIMDLMKDAGVEDSGFFDIEEWKDLSPEDLIEIKKHFEWVAQKAKERNAEKE